jgi:small neutral amino acid transporter SnatA (MarC family)
LRLLIYPVEALPYSLSRASVAGSVLLVELGLRALSRSAEVGSEEDEELTSAESSRPLTHPSTSVMAAMALLMD